MTIEDNIKGPEPAVRGWSAATVQELYRQPHGIAPSGRN